MRFLCLYWSYSFECKCHPPMFNATTWYSGMDMYMSGLGMQREFIFISCSKWNICIWNHNKFEYFHFIIIIKMWFFLHESARVSIALSFPCESCLVNPTRPLIPSHIQMKRKFRSVLNQLDFALIMYLHLSALSEISSAWLELKHWGGEQYANEFWWAVRGRMT